MGFLTVEYHIRNVLDEGMSRLREHPEELDMVFAELTTGSIGKKLGRKTLDAIKEFFVNNDIPVVSAFNPNQPVLPSVTVHLVSSIESQQYRRFQDQAGYTSETVRPAQLSDSFRAESYNPSTGLVTLPAAFSSKYLLPKQPILSVKDNTSYIIDGIVNSSSPVSFYIKSSDGTIPKYPDLSDLVIISKLNYENKRMAASIFEETFEIRMYAPSNTDQAIWLYYITSYILFLNKQYFEEVGLANQTISSGEFIRDFTKIPNNIWGRFLRVRFIVEHSWLENISTQSDVTTPEPLRRLTADYVPMEESDLTVIPGDDGFFEQGDGDGPPVSFLDESEGE